MNTCPARNRLFLSKNRLLDNLTGASQEIIPSSAVSNDSGDVDKNGKKAIGLDWQNNNFACASRFFVHFFAVAARLIGVHPPQLDFKPCLHNHPGHLSIASQNKLCSGD